MPFASSAIIALSGSSFREAVVHPRRGGVSGIRCLAAREYPDVEIAVQLEEEGDGAACEYKTYSSDLLRDEGIGLDETIPLVPGAEGTEVVPAGSNQEMRKLLEGGLSLAEIAMPKTRPENAAQLALFGDA